MPATHTHSNSAASAPAAVPNGSQPSDTLAANTEHEVGEADIMAALAQFSAEPNQPKADAAGDDDALEPAAQPTAEDNGEDDGADTAEASADGEQLADDATAGDPAGDDADAEDSPEAAAATPPAQPAEPKRDGRNDRIDELTARAKSTEAELAAERERTAFLTAQTNGDLVPSQLDHIDTPADLRKQREQVLQLRQRLFRSPNGMELPDPRNAGKTISYDADQVADLLAQTDRLVLEDIPARGEWIAKRDAADAAAKAAYAWLGDVRSGYGAEVQKVIQANPALRKVGPNYRLIAADALIGQSLRDAGVAVTPELVERLKAEAARKPIAARPGVPAKPTAAAPAPVRRVPPAAPSRAGVIPARATVQGSARRQAEQRLQKSSGGVDDVARLVAAGM